MLKSHFRWYGEEVKAELDNALDNKLEQSAEELAQYAKDKINQGASGYPKSKSGNLVRSIDTQKLGKNEYIWLSDAEYAKYLELKRNYRFISNTNRDNIYKVRRIMEQTRI
jgi:hypothetical protein